jgi:hypothetical protein
MTQNTNLNVTPYYDDFDKSKNFHKVLYRPGFPIQARELTTMQSILQNQIENMGDHFFKDGTVVIPGQVGFDNNVDCILIQSNFFGSEVELYRKQLDNTIVRGNTSGVKAKVLYSIPAEESEKGFITLYVKYIEAGGVDKTILKFLDNEQLTSENEIIFSNNIIEIGRPFAQLIPSEASFIGSVAYINAGVYYIRGFFVDVSSQYVILEQYKQNPSYRVGLQVQESIITPEDDDSLNDNSVGTSNYSAPGAHRLKISTTYIKKVITDDADKDFIELIRINNGRIQTFVERTAYNELEKQLAQRTHDITGDFMITPFDVQVRECLNDGKNDGVYEPGELTDDLQIPASEDYYTIKISPGKAYLKGFKVETTNPTFLDVEKPRDFLKLENNILPYEYGNFVRVRNVFGSPLITGDTITKAYQIVELKDTENFNQGQTNGNTIGFARVCNWQYEDTGDGSFGNEQDVYRAHLFDISMLSKIKLDSEATIPAGCQLVGKVSKSTGFIRISSGATTITSDILELINVTGSFRDGEDLLLDGKVVGTITSSYQYQFSDVRQLLGRGSSGAVIFTCDTFVGSSSLLTGNKFTYNSVDNILTGFNSNIANDVRPYDRIYFDRGNYFLVDPLPEDLNLNEIFNYQNQTIKVSLGNDPDVDAITPDNGTEYNILLRTRTTIEGQDQSRLFTILPKLAIRDINDESFLTKKSYEIQLTNDGFTVAVPDTQQFSAISNTSFSVVVTSRQFDSPFSVGQVLNLQTNNPAGAAFASFNTSGIPRTTITVSNLTGVNSVTFTATVSINTVSTKVKNSSRMSVWNVNRTINQNEQTFGGLVYSPLYGTRVEDNEISLGITDAYKLHAVYESDTEADAVIPYITLVEPAFFSIGSIVEGRISKAKALVVDFNSSTLRLSVVYQTDQQFSQNETIIGVNNLGLNIQGLISDVDGSINPGSRNITSNYYLSSGQTDQFYGFSKIVRRPGFNAPIRKLKIVADFFSHEASGDYFCNKSYSSISYKDIPIYSYNDDVEQATRTVGGFALSDVLDFRPAPAALVDGLGSVANPFFLQCSSLDFPSREFGSSKSTTFNVPIPNTDIRLDYSFYLPRIDKLYVDELGKFYVIKGVSAESPLPPEDRDNALLLSVFAHTPYGFSSKTDSKVFQENIKRFTMRDINSLERRVKNIEYYSLLTLLETDTNSLVITDEFGNNKFKNGFIVDSFENHTVSRLEDPDYAASLDFAKKTLRPSHYTTSVSLQYNENESSNVVRNTGIITLPFDREVLINQPYASFVENVNPFNVFTFIGGLSLNPTSDNWVDTEIAPVNIEQVEGNFEATARLINADQNGFGPIQWGAWQEDWSGARTTVSQQHSWWWGWPWWWWGWGWWGWWWWGHRGVITTTTTTTGIIERRTGTQSRVVETFDTRSLGTRVINRSNIPFMRSRNIALVAERLKPSTRYYGFFDNVAISQYITPKLIEIIKNPNTDSRTNNIPFQIGERIEGYRLVSGTDQIDGRAIFSAEIMAPNHDWRSNPYTEQDLPSEYSAQTDVLNININTLAEEVSGQYFGQAEIGMLLVGMTSSARAIVKDKKIITDRTGKFMGSFFIPNGNIPNNPRWETGRRLLRLSISPTDQRFLPGSSDASSAQANFEASGILETLQETILSIRNAEIVTTQLTEERVTSRTRTEQQVIGWWDPLAQSFMVEERGGLFLESVDIYFGKKDANIPISVQIRIMENGFPSNRILPLSTCTLYPEEIEISENSSIPTNFKFQAPIYVSDTEEYCIVLFTDSNEYEVWISEMGQIDITGDRTISAQPYAGVLFKSQNASTWSPNQLQDLKFTLYRAKFGPLSGKLVLNNTELNIGNRGILNLRQNPITTYKPNQTLILNDNSAVFTVGARIYQSSTNASANIISVDTQSSPNRITVSDIEGTFIQGSNIGGTIINQLNSSRSIAELTVDLNNINGDFGVGKLITGQTSGATAFVTEWNSTTGVILVNYVSKQFDTNEIISQTNPSVSAPLLSSTYSGDSIGKYPSTQTIYPESGKKITVFHSNHGMHDLSNNVIITGIRSEVAPTTLRQEISSTDTTILVRDASAFHKRIGGFAYSESNPGYLRINGEIIQYVNISADGFTITVNSDTGRGVAGTTARSHPVGSIVECYNLDGIPLIEINKTHDRILNPTLDSYELRTSSVATFGISGGGIFGRATQNIPYEVLTPNIANVLVTDTNLFCRLNRTSGTSINSVGGLESSFVNTNSYDNITINEQNRFNNQSLVLSRINEDSKLSGKKSLTMELLLESNKDTVSPVIDLDRVSVVTTSNRVNEPENWDLSRIPGSDPHRAVYITRMVSLDDQVSRSLKVLFDANRPGITNFRVLYRVVPVGFSGDEESILWQFFNNTGRPDKEVTASEDPEFKSYEYTVSGLEFEKYQIKIVMSSSNQAFVPQIKYFRAIATAT